METSGVIPTSEALHGAYLLFVLALWVAKFAS